MAEPTADAELALINKVELRLAMANSDTKLEPLLNLYLPPLLLKFRSRHAAVREKMLSVCQHLLTRINSSHLHLPVLAMLNQLKSPSDSGDSSDLFGGFSYLFIVKGLAECSPEDLRGLIMPTITGISALTPSNASRCFRVLLKLLETWQPPSRGSAAADLLATELPLASPELSKDAQFICRCFSQLFLLDFSAIQQLPETPAAAAAADSNLPASRCPGLTAREVYFLTQNLRSTFSRDSLLRAKTDCLRFVSSGIFAEIDVFVPLLIASTDTNSTISNTAEDYFKRLTVSVEQSNLTDTLFVLFLGELGRPPVKPTLQAKIAGLLAQSRPAAASPRIVDVISRCLDAEYGKLRHAGAQLLLWTATVAPNEALRSVAQQPSKLAIDLASAARSALYSDTSSSATFRATLFDALGEILFRAPELLPDMEYLQFLFRSLAAEPPEGRPAVQAALSRLIPRLGGLPAAPQALLREMLADTLLRDVADASVKFVCVKIAARAFPFADAEARVLCVVGAAAGNRADVREEARRGLSPYWAEMERSSGIGSGSGSGIGGANREQSVVESSAQSGINGMDGTDGTDGTNGMDVEMADQSTISATNLSPTSSSPAFYPAFPRLLQAFSALSRRSPALLDAATDDFAAFALNILSMNAVAGRSTVIVADAEWEFRAEKALELDETVRNLVKTHLAGRPLPFAEAEKAVAEVPDATEAAEAAILLARLAVARFTATSSARAGGVLLELLSLIPSHLVAQLVAEVPNVAKLLTSPSLAVHKLAAHVLALLVSHPANSDVRVAEFFAETVAPLVEFTDPSGAAGGAVRSVAKAHAAVLTAAFLLSRCALRGRPAAVPAADVAQFLRCVVSLLRASDKAVRDATVASVAQLALFGCLSPDVHPTVASTVASTVAQITESVQKLAETGLEEATTAFGYLSLTSDASGDSSEFLRQFAEPLLQLHRHASRADFLFASGEALTVVATGWQSKALVRHIDVAELTVASAPLPRRPAEFGDAVAAAVVARVLSEAAAPQPSRARCGCVWLLAFAQHCATVPAVAQQLPAFHAAFARFLSHRDEFLQECASKGLQLVYENGSAELRATLVSGLLQSLTGGQRGAGGSGGAAVASGGVVTPETELFAPGALPTGDGSVSTYRDVLSLAAEAGDPSLVYKFMALAADSAIWTSRRGAAFGLSGVLTKAALTELQTSDSEVGRRLIPKLYRYRFDPNGKVAQSMQHIWNILVPNSAATVAQHFSDILDELVTGLGSREWRVRQASAEALVALLPAAPPGGTDELEKVWEMAFRAADDVKESVRAAGAKLATALAGMLVRRLEAAAAGGAASKVAQTQQQLKRLLPFLMGPKGLEAPAAEVRGFALQTVARLARVGGAALKPFVPDLVAQLVLQMSVLEPAVWNYVAQHAERDTERHNLAALTSARLAAVRGSPAMAAVEDLLSLADDPESVRATVASLRGAVRSAVGLPSKAAGSHAIIRLIAGNRALAEPHGDTLLRLCVAQLLDSRNKAVAPLYATAAAQCIRIASQSAVLTFRDTLEAQLLSDEENATGESAAAVAVEAAAAAAPDNLRGLGSAWVPLVFLGTHAVGAVRESFVNAWSDLSGGAALIRLYAAEIVAVAQRGLASPRWSVRQMCARAIAAVAQVTNVASVAQGASKTQPGGADLFGALLQAVAGRSWAGKEAVVEALVALAVKDPVGFRADATTAPKVVAALQAELKRRRSPDYVRAVLPAVAQFLAAYTAEKELRETFMAAAEPFLAVASSSDDSDGDSDVEMGGAADAAGVAAARKREEQRNDVLVAVAQSVGSNADAEAFRSVVAQFSAILNSAAPYTTWKTLIIVADTVAQLAEKISTPNSALEGAAIPELAEVWRSLVSATENPAIPGSDLETVRVAVVRAGAALRHIRDEDLQESVAADLRKMGEAQQSPVVRSELAKALSGAAEGK